MRIYTRGGDLAFEEHTFPDGQPHFKLLTYDDSFRDVTIEACLKSPEDVFRVLLAAEVLNFRGYVVSLDIRYLLAARMDRRIDNYQPATLDVTMRMLNQAFRNVRVLDVHNPGSVWFKNVLPHGPVKQVLTTLGDVLVCAPDKGATGRVATLVFGRTDDILQCSKHRNPQTGRIEKLTIEGGSRAAGRRVLIIDDICDGGATFVQLGNLLRDAGATEIHLFVTHLIMSKGHKVFEGVIDRIFCTDSYRDWSPVPFTNISCIPVSMEKL